MFGRFLNYISAYWLHTALFAILLFFDIAYIKEHGLRTLFRKTRPWKLVFAFYLAFILFITVFGRNTGTDPLQSVFDNFWPIDWEEEENIAAFMPLSFFYLFAYKPQKPMKSAILLSFAVSAFIELFQLIGRLGAFQFSDLLYNTVGGALGGLVYLIVRWCIGKVSDFYRKNDLKFFKQHRFRGSSVDGMQLPGKRYRKRNNTGTNR